MSEESDFFSEAAEIYISNLTWSADTPDISKTLVAGNIRNFARILREEAVKFDLLKGQK